MADIEVEIRQKTFRNDHLKALVNILYTSNWIESKQAELFKLYNLTALQFNILRILRGQYPKPSNLTLIRGRLIEKHSDVSRVIVRMHKSGLVDRVKSHTDKREASLLISEKGLNILSQLDERNDELEGIVGNLSELEAQTLSLLLDKIRA